MKSIYAIVVASLFIVVVTIVFQLAYVLIAVEYNTLAKSFAVLNEIRGVFRYLVGIPVYMLIMFFGGYIAADIARTKVLLHCLVVGFITVGGMLWLAMENNELTLSGMVVFVLSLAATMAGGWYWLRGDEASSA